MLEELHDVVVFKDLLMLGLIKLLNDIGILQVKCYFKFVVDLIPFSFPPS